MNIHGKINYIELPAADIEAVKAFFTKAFGWSFTDYGPDYTAFADEGLDGGFYRADLSASTANGSALVVFYSETLEETRSTVVLSGGTILKEIFDFPGGRRFHFADPNGNEFAVWSEPAEK
ncbi:MAG: VOC family protein [Gammaproteobacteria bacterium]|nr:VOC family protein [Gammaproteobacteria bacterium]MBU1831707.1 VOC family protein [Gammaproteobacteria bacterium]